MKLHPLVLPMNRVALLMLGVLGSQTALALTIPSGANCYSNNDSGYDTWIANNSAFGTLQAYYYYSNGSAYYETGTGTFRTTPPASVAPVNSGSSNSYCYHDSGNYQGNWLAYSIGSTSYTFQMQFWGEGEYYLNFSPISSWTTSGTCPGETNWAAAVSAVNTDATQTICNEDYILNIVTSFNVGGNDVGATLSIMDNPAGNAGGSQSSSSSVSTASASSSMRSTKAAYPADSGRWNLASRIFNKTRWAVVRNPETLALSGMSYAEDGLQHGKFVYCTFIHHDGNADIYSRQSTYNCQIAESCTTGQCGPETWHAMTEAVIIPGTFFDRPPTNNPAIKLLTPPVSGDGDIRQSLVLLPGIMQRKIHQTPDGKIKLMSVNLLKQEWLIAYDGQHLFAAVPHNQMGQPRFVQCQQTASTANDVTMNCAEAYRCHYEPCTDQQWSPVASITLTKTFFSAVTGNSDTLITGYYGAILDRKPDEDGLAYWRGIIANAKNVQQAFRDMARSLFNSPEYQSKHTSDSSYINDVYQALFQRQPDREGQEYWLNQLGSQSARKNILTAFLNSEEFSAVMTKWGF